MFAPEPSSPPPELPSESPDPPPVVPTIEVAWLHPAAGPHPNRCRERRRKPRLDGSLWGAEVDAAHWNEQSLSEEEAA